MWSETVALHSLSKCNIRLSWQIHQPADMEQGACGNYDAMFLLFSPSRCTFNRNFYPALRYTWNPFTIFFSQSHPFTRCLDLSPPPPLTSTPSHGRYKAQRTELSGPPQSDHGGQRRGGEISPHPPVHVWWGRCLAFQQADMFLPPVTGQIYFFPPVCWRLWTH